MTWLTGDGNTELPDVLWGRTCHRCSSHEDDLEYYPVHNREPVQSVSHIGRNMREFWQLSDDSGGAVEDGLELSYPKLWQTRKDTVAVVQAHQHKGVDQS